MNERLVSVYETKEQEPYGRNVEIRAYFLRHAPGDKASGHLTEGGINISKKYGEEFQQSSEGGEKYILKAYSSEMERANETAQTIIDTVNTERKGHTRIRLELGEKTEDARMPIDALNLPYSEYVKVNRKEEKVKDKIISLHGVAQRIASQIEHFVKMSSRLKSDSRVDLINITHLPWLSAFVKEVVGQKLEEETDQAKKKEIESKITDLGYLDGFELIIKRDGDNVRLSLQVGENEFSLTGESIRQLLEDWNPAKNPKTKIARISLHPIRGGYKRAKAKQK